MKVNEAIDIVIGYISEAEMEGKVDIDDPWCPVYFALADLKVKVEDEDFISKQV